MMKVKLCKVYTLECQQGDEICFRYNKIASLILYKAEDMQALSRWLHAIRKGDITEKKRGVKKYENTQLFLQVRN